MTPSSQSAAKPLRRQRSADVKLSRSAIVFLAALLLFSAVVFHHFHELSLPIVSGRRQKMLPATLVVYVFRHIDPEAIINLNAFLRTAVLANDEARYIIALDPKVADKEMAALPKLPSNAEFMRPPSPCFELGVVGEVLFSSGLVDISGYRYCLCFLHVQDASLQPHHCTAVCQAAGSECTTIALRCHLPV